MEMQANVSDRLYLHATLQFFRIEVVMWHGEVREFTEPKKLV